MKYLFPLLSIAACLMTSSARAQQPASTPPSFLRSSGITQNMNAQIPPDLMFRDETGKAVRIGNYFGAKPIVLSLVYFNCPSMCTEVLNGELRALQNIPMNLGSDYEAITVSFDPSDTWADAAVKKRIYTGLYGRPGAAAGWHFFTGDAASIQALTDAAGFHYTYDKASDQFAHATAIMLLTPDGRMSRYFYGVQYPSRDVRLGLVEASQGRIGSPTDAALLYCYHYDPLTGRYGLVIMNVVKLAGLATLLLLGGLLWILFRHERSRAQHNGGLVPGVRAR